MQRAAGWKSVASLSSALLIILHATAALAAPVRRSPSRGHTETMPTRLRNFCHCHQTASTFKHENEPCSASTNCIHHFIEELPLHQQVRLELLRELTAVRQASSQQVWSQTS